MTLLRLIFALVPVLFASLGRAAKPAAAGEAGRQLDAVEVSTNRDQRVPPPPGPRFMAGLPLRNLEYGFGWPERLGSYVVTASRTPQPPEHVAATLRVFDGPALQQAPAVTLDGVLRGLPGFSLFRRSDSLTANPTAQGVSLRGLGPSGASRSLVLLDGVPLNDPFGGWVAWSKLPREGLFRAEVVPGGGAAAWGNAALSGVLQFFALPVRTSLAIVHEPPKPMGWGSQGSARVALIGGSFGTRSAEVAVTAPAGKEIVQLLGRAFATEGYAVVAPERRGAIDEPAWSRHRWVQGRWRHALKGGIEFTLTARHFEENRGNGTPYTRNGTREKFAALTVAAQPADHFAWNVVAYGQDQTFASTFSAVNATRSAETPASDQFAVPAVALGVAWTGAWKHATTARTSAGADLRRGRGETREHYSYTAGRFTRLRVAGGRQQFLGLFALHERPFAVGWRATAGARLDGWTDTAGHRRESERDSGAVLRRDEYAGQRGTEFSPNAGLVWAASPSWRLRANAQHAFRRPTLNELYRPFRQGANVTEANAALRTERVLSSEVGAERTWWREVSPPAGARPGSAVRGKPVAALVLSAAVFRNELRDAVGNVTLARGPGTFPIVGTLAPGGLGRQRLNLERTRVQGIELAASWTPWPEVTFTGDALLNDASVREAKQAPALAGRRVAQVPRRSAALGATWRAPGAMRITPRVRYTGRQYEDDENQLTLGAVVVAEVSVSRALTQQVEVFLTLENIGDARVETGRSADGVVNLGTPRLVLAGLRGTW